MYFVCAYLNMREKFMMLKSATRNFSDELLTLIGMSYESKKNAPF